MLLCKINVVVQISLKHVDWIGLSGVSSSIDGSNCVNNFDKVVIPKTGTDTKKVVLRFLKARASKGNAIITRQWTDILVNCIGDQCLTFFGLNVNEVATAIQVGSHFLK
jgi:hypothetical protein